MTPLEFGIVLDKAGLPLSPAQKETLYKAWPMMRAMIARATQDLPREAEPSVTFQPEQK